MSKLYEIETKRELISDKDELIKRLISYGYERGAVSVEIDDYYSRSDVDYMKTVECLRIRDTESKREITYKPPTTDFAATTIIKEETNLPLASRDDIETARQLLLAIGMVHLVKVEKHRQSYTKIYSDQKVTVSIDELPQVGTYVEVEILSQDPKTAKATINKVEVDLRLSSLPMVTLPYRDIVMQS